jgi:hypothetical protein
MRRAKMKGELNPLTRDSFILRRKDKEHAAVLLHDRDVRANFLFHMWNEWLIQTCGLTTAALCLLREKYDGRST